MAAIMDAPRASLNGRRTHCSIAHIKSHDCGKRNVYCLRRCHLAQNCILGASSPHETTSMYIFSRSRPAIPEGVTLDSAGRASQRLVYIPPWHLAFTFSMTLAHPAKHPPRGEGSESPRLKGTPQRDYCTRCAGGPFLGHRLAPNARHGMHRAAISPSSLRSCSDAATFKGVGYLPRHPVQCVALRP